MAEFMGAKVSKHAIAILDVLVERGVIINRSDGMRQGITLLAQKYGVEITAEDMPAVPA